MEIIIEDYGQAIVFIIFGGGIITLMSNLLGWVISNGVVV